MRQTQTWMWAFWLLAFNLNVNTRHGAPELALELELATRPFPISQLPFQIKQTQPATQTLPSQQPTAKTHTTGAVLAMLRNAASAQHRVLRNARSVVDYNGGAA